MLVTDGLVPVFPTPVAHRGHCTGKAALGRDLPDHVLAVPRPSPDTANRLDRLLPREIRQTNFGYRLHDQHLDLGLLKDQEACVDPYPRGPDWMPITPKMGSLFHADSQPDRDL